MYDEVDQFKGQDMNCFGVGDASKALEITLKYVGKGNCIIMYKNHDGEEGRFTCVGSNPL